LLLVFLLKSVKMSLYCGDCGAGEKERKISERERKIDWVVCFKQVVLCYSVYLTSSLKQMSPMHRGAVIVELQ